MNRILFAALAVAATAAAMVVPSEAGLVRMPVEQDRNAVGIDSGWRADVAACRVKPVLKYDYAGSPYLKKVRVCA